MTFINFTRVKLVILNIFTEILRKILSQYVPAHHLSDILKERDALKGTLNDKLEENRDKNERKQKGFYKNLDTTLANTICPLLSQYFHESCLEKTLREMDNHFKDSPDINQAQKEKSYENLDITLLCAIISLFQKNARKKENGMSREKDNCFVDIVILIRTIRNKYAHAPKNDLSEDEFISTWNDFETVCLKTDKAIQGNYSQTLKKYRQCDIIIDVDTPCKLNALQVKCRHPKTFSREMARKSESIEKWIEDSSRFYPTRASKEVERRLCLSTCVTVSGNAGSGKSSIAQNVALSHLLKDWIIIPVEDIEEIITCMVKGSTSRHLFVLDDPLGKDHLNDPSLSNWNCHEKTLKHILNSCNIKVLFTCRKNILNDKRVPKLLKNAEVVIDDNEWQLTTYEKEQILFLKCTDIIEISDLEKNEIVKCNDSYPLLCDLFAKKEIYRSRGSSFFIAPYLSIGDEISDFKENDRRRYCALVTLLERGGVLSHDSITKNRQSLERVFELCGSPKNMSHKHILDELENLKGSLVEKIGEQFTFRSDIVVNAIIFILQKNNVKELVRFCPLSYLRKWIRVDDAERNKIESSFCHITVSDGIIDVLCDRYFEEIERNSLEVCLCPIFKNEKVQACILDRITKMPDRELQECFLKSSRNGVSPLPPQMVLNQISFETIKHLIPAIQSHVHTQLLVYESYPPPIANMLHVFDFLLNSTEFLPLVQSQFKNKNSAERFVNELKNIRDTLATFLNNVDELESLKANEIYAHELENIAGYMKAEMVVYEENAHVNDEQTKKDNNELEQDKRILDHEKNTKQGKNEHLNAIKRNQGQNGNKNAELSNLGENQEVHQKQSVNNWAQVYLTEQGRDDHQQGRNKHVCAENNNEGEKLHMDQEEEGQTIPVWIELGVKVDNKQWQLERHTIYGKNEQAFNEQTMKRENKQLHVEEESNEHVREVLTMQTRQVVVHEEEKWDQVEHKELKENKEINEEQLDQEENSQGWAGENKNKLKFGENVEQGQNKLMHVENDVLEEKNEIHVKQEQKDQAPEELKVERKNKEVHEEEQYHGEREERQEGHICGEINFFSTESIQAIYSNEWATKAFHFAFTNYLRNVRTEISPNQQQFLNEFLKNLALHILNMICIIEKEIDKNHSTLRCWSDAIKRLEVLESCFPLMNDSNKKTAWKLILSHLLLESVGPEYAFFSLPSLEQTDLHAELRGFTSSRHDMITDLALYAYKTSPLSCLLMFEEIEIFERVIRRLLDMHIDKEILRQHNLFFSACVSGRLDIAKLNVERFGNDVITEKFFCLMFDFSSLHIVSLLNHVEIMDYLLQEQHVDVNIVDFFGNTPLHLVLYNIESNLTEQQQQKVISTIKTLRDLCADANQLNHMGASYLHLSCQHNYTEIVKLFFNESNINSKTNSGETPLLLAARKGNAEVVDLLLKNGANSNDKNEKGYTPLYLAAKRGSLQTFEKLLENNADLNIKSNQGETPLIVAASKGHFDVVKRIIEITLRVNDRDKTGTTVLAGAVASGRLDIVNLLLQNKANVNLTNKDGNGPLAVAANNGYLDISELLIRNDANIEQCNDNGESPLIIASMHGQSEIVQLLLNKGAKVNRQDNKKESSLWLACQRGHTCVTSILVKHDANEKLGDLQGGTPLFTAARHGHIGPLEVLLQTKCPVNQRDYNGKTALMTACENGHVGVVCTLLKYIANTNLSDNNGRTALWYASKYGYSDVVEILLNDAVDFDIRDNEKKSPLFVAAEGGYNKIVYSLVGQNVSMEMCDKKRRSPLSIAVAKGYMFIVKFLINEGADVNNKDIFGWTPLFYALGNDKKDALLMLIEFGAEVDVSDKEGNTPLHIAAGNGNQNMVRILIDRGNICSIDRQNEYGETAFFLACKNNFIDTASFLISRNADINIHNRDGLSPFNVARRNGNNDIIALISRRIELGN